MRCPFHGHFQHGSPLGKSIAADEYSLGKSYSYGQKRNIHPMHLNIVQYSL